MADIARLFRCVGKVLLKQGCQALAKVVPFGDVVYELVKGIWEEYHDDKEKAELRAELVGLAQAKPDVVHREAEKVAAEAPPELRLALVSYLDQMPSTIRQSLRRSADPSGTTIPATRQFRKPEDLLPFLPTSLPRFKPGDRPLDADWELVEMLGKGGFGEVWKAKHVHQSQKKPVALKFCLDPDAANSLRQEAALHDVLDRLRGRGRGFVPLLETFLGADPPCLMFEYIEGGELTGLLREGKFPPERAGRFVHLLASIVASAHRMDPPLVHRDLKPANVLLRRRERGKVSLFVADFGIGGLAARQVLREQTRSCSQTQLSAARGAYTPLYASPQQVQGQKPDPRDDVYALGVIWFQLLMGDLGLTAIPSDWRDEVKGCGLDDGQTDLLGTCLASRSERRPADAEQLANQLSSLLAPAPPPADADQSFLVRLSALLASSARKEALRVMPGDEMGLTNLLSVMPESSEIENRPGETVELSTTGKWLSRPATSLTQEWGFVQDTPGKVRVHVGEVYKLKLSDAALDNDLDALARDLRHVTSLRSLDLSECRQVTDAGLAHLNRLNFLQWLDLPRFGQVTDAGLAHLRGLSFLQSLDLRWCVEVTDAGLAYLRDLNFLQSLTLCGCEKVTDAGLAHLRGLTSLRSLTLGGGFLFLSCFSKGMVQVTDAGLAHLRSLTALHSLDLSGCGEVTNAGLASLRSLTSLQSLDLGECVKITDGGLVHLRGLTSLQVLSLFMCKKVKGAGLAHLSGLTSLQSLNLGLCEKMKDDGLHHLSGLTSLTSLNLRGCDQVTDTSLAALRRALPNCAIEFERLSQRPG